MWCCPFCYSLPPSPLTLPSQQASPIFCLIAAVSWQKATIFALLLSENKLQIIYSFTHTHAQPPAHTLSVRCKVGNRNWLSFFFLVACFASAQARLHQNGRGKQHKDRSQPNWVLPNTGPASCPPCLPALFIWAKSHFDQNSERWHHLHSLSALSLHLFLSLTLCYFSFYLLF